MHKTQAPKDTSTERHKHRKTQAPKDTSTERHKHWKTQDTITERRKVQALKDTRHKRWKTQDTKHWKTQSTERHKTQSIERHKTQSIERHKTHFTSLVSFRAFLSGWDYFLVDSMPKWQRKWHRQRRFFPGPFPFSVLPGGKKHICLSVKFFLWCKFLALVFFKLLGNKTSIVCTRKWCFHDVERIWLKRGKKTWRRVFWVIAWRVWHWHKACSRIHFQVYNFCSTNFCYSENSVKFEFRKFLVKKYFLKINGYTAVSKVKRFWGLGARLNMSKFPKKVSLNSCSSFDKFLIKLYLNALWTSEAQDTIWN